MLRNCGYVIENKECEIDPNLEPGTKEYANAKQENDDKKIKDGIDDGNVVHIHREINIDGKKYIAIETIYKNKLKVKATTFKRDLNLFNLIISRCQDISNNP